MSKSWLWVVAILATTIACDQPQSPTATTGLAGVVMRGPITPVCRIDIPCDGPFSASFSVEQNGRRVSQFRSDADGRFSVTLGSGIYQIIPSPDAPIFAPQMQVKTVEVLRVGITQVRLDFDTGIR